MTDTEQIETSNSPSETVINFFNLFNQADEYSLDLMFDAPCVFIIDHKTRLFEKYSDAIDFEALRRTGWDKSNINSLETLYEDLTTSMVTFNFSRLDGCDCEISNTDATHLLVKKGNDWKIKGVFIHGNIELQ